MLTKKKKKKNRKHCVRIEVVCPSSRSWDSVSFLLFFSVTATSKPLVGHLLCWHDRILRLSLCVPLFQNAATGLLLSNKEEFAMAPVEIGYPSILLANTIAKMTAIRGMYLHLFAKAKRFTHRRPPFPDEGSVETAAGVGRRSSMPWPWDSLNRV